MRRLLRLLILSLPLLPLLAVLAGCAVNPVTGKQSFTAFMSREDEIRIGAQEHPKLIKEFGGAYTDTKLRAYIKRTGLKLASHADGSGLVYTFTLLNDDKVNAFALPGGYVYITRGLLALAENEAEVAGVLAHEIGHVTARHTAERYSTTQATNLGLIVLGALGSAAGVPSGIGRLAGLGAQAALSSYSREQELEADMLGVRYMTRAGYSPHAMSSFFEKMQAHDHLIREMEGNKQDPTSHIMATHPRTAKRITQAIQLAHATPVADPLIGRPEFLDEIDGMVFGDDPQQGVRRGRVFMHPELRIRFEAPPDFVLFNSARQVVARGPGKAVMVFDMAKEESARRTGSVKAYIANVWARGLRLSGFERISINGQDAATASVRINTRSGTRDVRLVAVRGGPDRIFRLAFITPPAMTGRLSADFRRATYSFRRISEDEARAIKPLRIKVVTVRPGDTPQNLADRFPVEAFHLKWFETLNGLRPGQGLRTGGRVKVVAE
ncbi:MAG: M48 family metalloprotease [Rhodospirillales bacterium]|nr:M48 family metalloprotease [Alphaproteobacteria bacterium]MBL6947084.1 M48 family metalloprotease [Rhodospirillales bacterium]